MDRYSELEVKYRATNVPTSIYWDKMKKLSHEFANGSLKQRVVVGTDTFFVDGLKNVLRYRRAGTDGNDHPVLTYKRRKHFDANSVNRIEVDLFLDKDRAGDEDVRQMLQQCLGYSQHFEIQKESHIAEISCPEGYTVVIALYDVFFQSSIFRYLEIEVEKDSQCSEEEGLKALELWSSRVEAEFPVGSPLGQSLYELHAPRGSLYIQGSF